MEAAHERDFPRKDPSGVPIGRRCTCGADMMKREVARATTAGSQEVRWACSCCGLDERIAYRGHGSGERSEE